MGLTLVCQAVVLTPQEPRHSRGGGGKLLRIGCLCRHRLRDGVGRIHQRGTLRALVAQYLTSLPHMISNCLDISGLRVPWVQISHQWAIVTKGYEAFRNDVLIPLPTGVTLVGRQDHSQDVLEILRCHLTQHVPYIGWPMSHAHIHRHMQSLRFEQVGNTLRLLECQVIKGRKPPKLGIMGGNLRHPRLGCWVLTHNALDKTRSLIPWAGLASAAAPWRGTTKSNA